MSESINMALVENLKTSNEGRELHCEYRNFPVTFVNALRRVILAEVPTVVIRDVQILENTTQLPHEMLKHRVEMLPVNVTPDDASTIRDSKIELRVIADKTNDKVKTITTDDFVIDSSRTQLLLKDPEFGKPILFLRLRPGESIHIKGRLAVENYGVSQVSLGSTNWHIDPEIAKADREKWEKEGKDPALFDNFYVQQSYSKDEKGRPNWIDMNIESIGVLPAKEILKYAVSVLRKKMSNYMKEAIEKVAREKEEGSFSVSLDQGGHTIGALLQEVMYGDLNVDFVGYDIPHPLRSTMVLRFYTKKAPESILRSAADAIEEYCSVVEKVL